MAHQANAAGQTVARVDSKFSDVSVAAGRKGFKAELDALPPAEIAPSMSPWPDEWAPPSSAPASAFPPVVSDVAAGRHRELAGQLIGYVSRGDR